jgi:hypothetical protein
LNCFDLVRWTQWAWYLRRPIFSLTELVLDHEISGVFFYKIANVEFSIEIFFVVGFYRYAVSDERWLLYYPLTKKIPITTFQESYCFEQHDRKAAPMTNAFVEKEVYSTF